MATEVKVTKEGTIIKLTTRRNKKKRRNFGVYPIPYVPVGSSPMIMLSLLDAGSGRVSILIQAPRELPGDATNTKWFLQHFCYQGERPEKAGIVWAESAVKAPKRVVGETGPMPLAQLDDAVPSSTYVFRLRRHEAHIIDLFPEASIDTPGDELWERGEREKDREWLVIREKGPAMSRLEEVESRADTFAEQTNAAEQDVTAALGAYVAAVAELKNFLPTIEPHWNDCETDSPLNGQVEGIPPVTFKAFVGRAAWDMAWKLVEIAADIFRRAIATANPSCTLVGAEKASWANRQKELANKFEAAKSLYVRHMAALSGPFDALLTGWVNFFSGNNSYLKQMSPAWDDIEHDTPLGNYAWNGQACMKGWLGAWHDMEKLFSDFDIAAAGWIEQYIQNVKNNLMVLMGKAPFNEDRLPPLPNPEIYPPDTLFYLNQDWTADHDKGVDYGKSYAKGMYVNTAERWEGANVRAFDIVGELVAGQIAAGAIAAHHFMADMAFINNTLRSDNYQTGYFEGSGDDRKYVSPVGWRLDSLPFFDPTAIARDENGKAIYQGAANPHGGEGVIMEDGTRLMVQMELGGNISIAGKRAATLVDMEQIAARLLKVNKGNKKGYVIFGNGMCIQWATVLKQTTATGHDTIPLVVPFEDAFYSVTANSLRNDRGVNGHDYIFNKTTSSFQLVHEMGDGYDWIAMGYVSKETLNAL